MARAAAGQPEAVAAAAVGAELEAEEPALLDRLHHDRARAVAEEDERRAVVEVEDLREHVAADDERAAREPGGEHPVRLRDRVDEAGAPGEQVVRRGVGHPELVGEQRGAGREHHVRRHRRAEDEVDRRRLDARALERLPRRGERDVGQRLLLGREAPLADARALDDPLVRRVDELREVVVRHDLRRHVHAETGDPDPRAVRFADHCSTANVRVPRTASSPSTVARALPRPIGPRTVLERALERQLVAGPHDALEAHVVDAGEERELAAVLLLHEHGNRAGLRERLDHLHAGHDRVAGKVPGAILLGHGLARDDARARLELDDLVEQQERIAVRKDLLDLRLAERHVHATCSSSRARRLLRARCA